MPAIGNGSIGGGKIFSGFRGFIESFAAAHALWVLLSVLVGCSTLKENHDLSDVTMASPRRVIGLLPVQTWKLATPNSSVLIN